MMRGRGMIVHVIPATLDETVEQKSMNVTQIHVRVEPLVQ